MYVPECKTRGSSRFTWIAAAVGFALATPLPGQAEEKLASASPSAAPAISAPAAANDNSGAVYYDANGKLVLKAHVKKNKLAKGKKGKKGDEEDEEDEDELLIGASGERTSVRLPFMRALECRI